jgi:hypothetical protein
MGLPLVFTLILFSVIAFGEVFSRLILGLGTPPLTETHPRIEYLLSPNQDVMRFGNRIFVNEFGMRSPPRSQWDGKRVLVFGDSVLNGSSLTDQQSLATTIASNEDSDHFYGNVSAGSWGIDNMLGWVQTFGLLNADTVIFVLSSHDAKDAPTYSELNPLTHPARAPWSALWEGIIRYLPRYLPKSFTSLLFEGDSLMPVESNRIESNRITGKHGDEVLPGFLDLLGEAGVQVCGVLHATMTERKGSSFSGLKKLKDIFDLYEVPVVFMHDVSTGGIKNDAKIYRDDIHLNESGQLVLKEALLVCVSRATKPLGLGMSNDG